MERILQLVLRHHRLLVGAFLLLSMPFAFFAVQPSFSTGVQNLFEEDAADMVFYRQFQQTFGNEEVVLVALQGDHMFSPEMVLLTDRLTGLVAALPGVGRVTSMTSILLPEGNEDEIGFTPLFGMDDLSPESIDRGLGRSLESELAGNLYSEDRRTSALLIELEKMDTSRRETVLTSIRRISEELRPAGVSLHYTGMAFTEQEMNDTVEYESVLFPPLLGLICAIVVWMILRDFLLMVLALAHVLMVLIFGTGLFVMAGRSYDITNVVITPILLAISLAAAVHILTRFRERRYEKGESTAEAVRHSMQRLWVPVLLTTLTTAVGYFSFLATTVPAVKTLGLFTGIGVLMAFVLTITFLPALLLTFVSDGRRGLLRASVFDRVFLRMIGPLGDFVIRRRRAIGLGFVIITVLTSLGIARLPVATDFLAYLRDSNVIKQDTLLVEQQLMGVVPVEVVVEAAPGTPGFDTPQAVAALTEIQEAIRAREPGLLTVNLSLPVLFRAMNKAMNGVDAVPDTPEDIIDFHEMGDGEVLERVVSPDYRRARLNFAARFSRSLEFREKVRPWIESELSGRFAPAYRISLTDQPVLFANFAEKLTESLLRSFLTAFCFITLMMYLICRNLKQTVLCMIPNIFPIAATFGFMGWIGIPLDVSTILIASVTLGIAVDDTIHFVTWMKRNLEREDFTPAAAIRQTYLDTAKPIVGTTVILCCAYLLFLTGEMKPTAAFGGLAALALVLAVIADLIFLPALILLTGGKESAAGQPRPVVAE